MKIKQITSLILMLTMLVLSTSCGKSTSVNPNLPTHQNPDTTLNQTSLQKKTLVEWIVSSGSTIFNTVCVSSMIFMTLISMKVATEAKRLQTEQRTQINELRTQLQTLQQQLQG